MNRPWVIGVTGNIACGKTAVMRRLAEHGAVTIDGDVVYRELTGPDSSLVRTLAERFGQHIVAADGSLNRPELGRIVFSDAAALRDLDHLTHPAVIDEVVRRIGAAQTDVVATDGVKLIESGMGDRCDEVWVVTCSPLRQRERLMARNGLSAEEADRRIAAQPLLEKKLANADVVIDNKGSLDDLRDRVDAAWMVSTVKRANAGYLPNGYDS